MIVFITGGIGTGKSTVLQAFADLGAPTLSADAVVHDLYDQPQVQAAVADALGVGLPLDRKRIASLVFGDPALRQRLEAVLHPLVAARVAVERQRHDVLVYEVPLLPQPQPDDVVVVVEAPTAVRRARLLGRGMSVADVDARMAAQPSATQYRSLATHVLDNGGDPTSLRQAVAAIWTEVRHGARAI